MGVENIKAVQEALKDVGKKYGNQKKYCVIVGYTGKYALPLHENIEMKWRGLPRKGPKNTVQGKGVYWGPTGQAKYLEQPAREMASELGKLIQTAVSRGATILEAIFIAGERLRKVSRELVPVVTTALKNSAFVEEDKEFN